MQCSISNCSGFTSRMSLHRTSLQSEATARATDICCLPCRIRHGGHSNAVHLNDVFFATHAALLAGLTLVQCFIYERGTQRVSSVCATAIGTIVVLSMISCLLVVFDNQKYPLLSFLYWLSWVKMGVTFFKYMPQVSFGWLAGLHFLGHVQSCISMAGVLACVLNSTCVNARSSNVSFVLVKTSHTHNCLHIPAHVLGLRGSYQTGLS